MNFENFTKEKKTIDLGKANLEALKYLVFFVLVFAVPYYLIWGFEMPKLEGTNFIVKAFLPLLAVLVGIVIYELIHGIFFA